MARAASALGKASRRRSLGSAQTWQGGERVRQGRRVCAPGWHASVGGASHRRGRGCSWVRQGRRAGVVGAANECGRGGSGVGR